MTEEVDMKVVHDLDEWEQLTDQDWTCLSPSKSLENGHVVVPDQLIAARQDFLAGKACYFGHKDVGYLRYFHYDEAGERQNLVDFGRPFNLMTELIHDLCTLLEEPLVVPRHFPDLGEDLRHAEILPFEADVRRYEFGPEHPVYRVGFGEDGWHEVYSLDTDEL